MKDVAKMRLPSTTPRTHTRPAPSQGTVRLTAPERSRRYVFLLLDRFTMMAFASAIEPLRLANQVSGVKLYDWKLASEDGQDVTC